MKKEKSPRGSSAERVARKSLEVFQKGQNPKWKQQDVKIKKARVTEGTVSWTPGGIRIDKVSISQGSCPDGFYGKIVTGHSSQKGHTGCMTTAITTKDKTNGLKLKAHFWKLWSLLYDILIC